MVISARPAEMRYRLDLFFRRMLCGKNKEDA